MSANPRPKFLKKDSTIFMGALNEYRTEAKKKDTEKAKIVEVSRIHPCNFVMPYISIS
jgi:hypothetical protein